MSEEELKKLRKAVFATCEYDWRDMVILDDVEKELRDLGYNQYSKNLREMKKAS